MDTEEAARMRRLPGPHGEFPTAPPKESWDDWVELEGRAWPRRIEHHYMLVPTICFNCEAGCGQLAYVDRETLEIRKIEGNPEHPASRGRLCAKGPATLNQITDPERVLYPQRRVGKRGAGKWERVSIAACRDLERCPAAQAPKRVKSRGAFPPWRVKSA